MWLGARIRATIQTLTNNIHPTFRDGALDAIVGYWAARPRALCKDVLEHRGRLVAASSKVILSNHLQSTIEYHR